MTVCDRRQSLKARIRETKGIYLTLILDNTHANTLQKIVMLPCGNMLLTGTKMTSVKQRSFNREKSDDALNVSGFVRPKLYRILGLEKLKLNILCRVLSDQAFCGAYIVARLAFCIRIVFHNVQQQSNFWRNVI